MHMSLCNICEIYISWFIFLFLPARFVHPRGGVIQRVSSWKHAAGSQYNSSHQTPSWTGVTPQQNWTAPSEVVDLTLDEDSRCKYLLKSRALPVFVPISPLPPAQSFHWGYTCSLPGVREFLGFDDPCINKHISNFIFFHLSSWPNPILDYCPPLPSLNCNTCPESSRYKAPFSFSLIANLNALLKKK